MLRPLILSVLLGLTSLAMFAQSAPPKAHEVFQLHVSVADANTLLLKWTIKPGFFLYKKSIRIEPRQTDEEALVLQPINLPKALLKSRAQGKAVPIYRHDLTLPVFLLPKQPGEFIYHIHAQGCADSGFCYPPNVASVILRVDKTRALISVLNPAMQTVATPTPLISTTTVWKDPFSHHAWYITLMVFFIFGLLLAFTPCVLPMLPVLSSMIMGPNQSPSRQRAFFLALSYVTGMSLTYALIGASVAFLGENLQVLMQAPVSITLLSLLFVVLAANMMDLIHFKLPASYHDRIAKRSHAHANGNYWGAAIMGGLATLILSPCCTAPMMGAIGYISQTHDIILGSLCLLSMGFGMGAPLLLLATSWGHFLPRAGGWMNHIKHAFALILFATAIDLISRIIPVAFSQVLWCSLLCFSLFLIHKNPFYLKQPMLRRMGVTLLFIGISSYLLIRPFMLHHDALASNTWTISTSLDATHEMMQHAKGKPIIIDFYATWCHTCLGLEQQLHHNPSIQRELARFVKIKVDISANNHQTHEASRYFHVIAPPTFIFINQHGDEEKGLRLVGEFSMQQLRSILHNIN